MIILFCLLVASVVLVIVLAFHYKKNEAPKMRVYGRLIGMPMLISIIVPILLWKETQHPVVYFQACNTVGMLLAFAGMIAYKIAKVKE